jgi:hypothetical protein
MNSLKIISQRLVLPVFFLLFLRMMPEPLGTFY